MMSNMQVKEYNKMVQTCKVCTKQKGGTFMIHLRLLSSMDPIKDPNQTPTTQTDSFGKLNLCKILSWIFNLMFSSEIAKLMIQLFFTCQETEPIK